MTLWVIKVASVHTKNDSWCIPSSYNVSFQHAEVNHILHSKENEVWHKHIKQKVGARNGTMIGNDNHSQHSMFLFVFVTAHPNLKLRFISRLPFLFDNILTLCNCTFKVAEQSLQFAKPTYDLLPLHSSAWDTEFYLACKEKPNIYIDIYSISRFLK